MCGPVPCVSIFGVDCRIELVCLCFLQLAQVVVVDVVTPELCVCRTAEGRLLEGKLYKVVQPIPSVAKYSDFSNALHVILQFSFIEHN